MYQLAAYVHLLAAIVWVGGTLFLALVLVPVARGFREPPGSGTRVLSAAARRFRAIAWGALAVLAVSGIWLLGERGDSLSDIATGGGWFFGVLRVKLAIFGLVLALSAVHDFVVGPALARRLEALRPVPNAGDSSLQRRRRAVAWLARSNLLLALVILALGVLLVRGDPF